MEIHETGFAWRFIRKWPWAILQALNLKMMVGGSMTLVGLLPPLCDNGNMLVDGGYSRRTVYQKSKKLKTNLSSAQLTIYQYVSPLPTPCLQLTHPRSLL